MGLELDAGLFLKNAVSTAGTAIVRAVLFDSRDGYRTGCTGFSRELLFLPIGGWAINASSIFWISLQSKDASDGDE